MELHEQLIETKIIPKFIKYKAPDSKLKSFEIKQLGGDTFMLTTCYQVYIVVLKSNSELKNFWLFVKISPQCEPDTYNLVQFDKLFTNEINAYTRIIPIFDSKQKYVKLRDSEVNATGSYLVLDDFSKGGWRLAKDMVNLSLDHICVAMHELAVFHGKFYALKLQNLDKFMEIVDLLHESRYTNDLHEGYQAAAVTGCKRAILSVQNSEIPKSFIQKLAHLIADSHKYGRRMVRPTEPLSTLCHGDYLRNNIAFRYALDEDENPIPTEAMMFDLQTIRHSSPMVDVCVFICNSTGMDVRETNFDKIFDSYFDKLIETIQFNLNDDNQLPEYFNRTRFLEEYVKFLPMGLSIASCFVPVLMNMDEMIFDLANPLGPEEMAHKVMTLGGETVDRELRSIIHQIYELSEELNVDIFSV